MILFLLMTARISSAIDSVFYEMDDDEIQDYINQVLEKPEDQNFKEVLQRMIVKDVSKRISAEELCSLMKTLNCYELENEKLKVENKEEIKQEVLSIDLKEDKTDIKPSLQEQPQLWRFE